MPKKRNGIRPMIRSERKYERSLVALMGEAYMEPLRSALVGYDPQTFLNSIKAIQRRVGTDPRFGQAEAEVAIRDIQSYQRARFARIARSVSVQLSIFGDAGDRMVAPILQEALVRNVGLIKNLAADYGDFAYERAYGIIQETGFNLGAQETAMREFLSDRGAGGTRVKTRARLIARDQNNKIIGELNQARHKSVGGKRYTWSTSADERVRGNHIHLNNTVQQWDTPPAGGGTTPSEAGHPGKGIQCRCIANFIFEEPQGDS